MFEVVSDDISAGNETHPIPMVALRRISDAEIPVFEVPVIFKKISLRL